MSEQTGPETTLIVSPVSGPTRRIRVVRSDVPGVPFVLEEAEWRGCHWHHTGSEELGWVEEDGDRYNSRNSADVYGGP